MTITNSTFSGNSADFGGGIFNNGGTMTVTNSTFSGNSAISAGGGIANADGTVTITNSTISGNSVILGGAPSAAAASPTSPSRTVAPARSTSRTPSWGTTRPLSQV
jgi:hypothetical protein